MIELIDVEKYYPHPSGTPVAALKNIHLQINSGEVFGIIGKSGAGKSTLLRCVNLLELPSSGAVKVAGQELTAMNTAELRKARQHIGMIFQHFNLLESKTVYDNVALPLVLADMSADEIKKIVLPLLELTGLQYKASAYPSALSGGQKQRVAIARALTNKPRVLLCDEATSALDQETTQTILALLNDINQQLGLTIMLITHEMDVIKTICDRVAVLDQGEIVEQNSIPHFLMHPHSQMGKTLSMAALKQELPEPLRHRLVLEKDIHLSANHNPLLRIFFQGSVTEVPIMAHLAQHFGLKLNILQASMDNIKTRTMGVMLLEVMNHHTHLQAAIDYLEQKNIFVEKVGYVTRTIDSAA